MLSKYLGKNKTKKCKYQSIDSSFIYNNQCREKLNRNTYYKGKKGIKISTIVDSNGIPLSILLLNGNESDIVTLIRTYQNIQIQTNSSKYTDHNRYKQYILADKWYYLKNNIDYIDSIGCIPIIAVNNRNTKDMNKIKCMSVEHKKIYKKRIIVENFFMKIKKYPKINIIYEKTIKSYNGLLLFVVLHLIGNHLWFWNEDLLYFLNFNICGNYTQFLY